MCRIPLTHGSQGVFVKYIQQETQTRVQIKGIGSGFVDQETGREADEPMYIHVTFVFFICTVRPELTIAHQWPG